MRKYRSTGAVYPARIDSRRLYMEASFFLLTKEQVTGFASEFVEWCDRQWKKDFITIWRIDGRQTKAEKLLKVIGNTGELLVGFEGAVQTEKIGNNFSFFQLLREIEAYENEEHPSDASTDYLNFFLAKKTQLINGDVSWKEFVLSFFKERGKLCISTAPFPELCGSIFSRPYCNNQTLFYGTISIGISVYAADLNVTDIADEMACFMKEQAEKYENINGFIGVTPLTFPSAESAHMCYFGDNVHGDGSHRYVGAEPEEWYPYYYLRAVEWFNIISPTSQNNISSLRQESIQLPTIKREKLKNGAIVVRLTIPVDVVDVMDLRPVKLLLYDGLYPGMRELPKSALLDEEYIAPIAKLRMQWECIPILDDEIIVTDQSVIFRHKMLASLEMKE